MFDEKSKSRTYLYLTSDAIQSKIDIVAYFSLALQILYIPSDMSNRQIYRLDGFSGKIHGEKVKSLPVYLIGQIARNERYTSNQIAGREILQDAFWIIQKANNIVGGRIVMVDVKTTAQGLIRFYKEHGFELISNDEATGLTQMIYMLGN